MPWWGWLLSIGLGGLVAGLVLWKAIGTGMIWDGLVRAATRGARAIFFAMLPGILKILKPASPEELDKFHKRVDRAEDHGLPGQRKKPKGW